MALYKGFELGVEKSMPHHAATSLIITLFSPVQSSNALSPMFVTEFGIAIDVNPVHPRKASFPMLVTEYGIVTDVNPVQ